MRGPEARLADFFRGHPRLAIAFSGGVDSAYLLYAALRSGAEVGAYYARSAFQPAFEREDARRMAAHLGVPLREVEVDVLSCAEVVENSPLRCYFCKRKLLLALREEAEREGFTLLADGSNASDAEEERPGMRALRELGVCSPLRDCGLDKAQVRRLSREAGLFTWDKPAYACLATRVPTGRAIRAGDLARTERAETYLRALGFQDLRVRLQGEACRIELQAEDLAAFVARRAEIVARLKEDYAGVYLDLEGRDE